VRGRAGHIQFFIDWLKERSITEPLEVTRPVLERYQRHLFHYRKANGAPQTPVVIVAAQKPNGRTGGSAWPA